MRLSPSLVSNPGVAPVRLRPVDQRGMPSAVEQFTADQFAAQDKIAEALTRQMEGQLAEV